MLLRAGNVAVVFTRLSSADDCELRNGVALVNVHGANSSAQLRTSDCFIFSRRLQNRSENPGNGILRFITAICLPAAEEREGALQVLRLCSEFIAVAKQCMRQTLFWKRKHVQSVGKDLPLFRVCPSVL